MTFIMSEERTSECLRTWAGGCTPYIFSFFLWKPGSKLQNTMSGFMRSMIWQMCKAKPSIIGQLQSRDTTLSYSPWTEAKLVEILRSALSGYRNDPLLFLIDGLDECTDNHSDLLDELQSLDASAHTKVCISSRPEQAFLQRLEALPFVRLQDLNYRDIFKYAHTKLKRGSNQTTELARQVASNAEGVFLWAVLVCDSLYSGLMAEDDGHMLLQRLHAYPKGLDDLFYEMFANLEEVYYKSLAFYFYAAQQRRFSVALAAASRSTQGIESLEHFSAMCEREATRITQQSKGLLQIRQDFVEPDGSHHDCAWSLKDLRTGSTTPFPIRGFAFRLVQKHLNLAIDFVHRSAYDYIFENQRADRVVWLKSVGEKEIIRKVLSGVLWLSQYGPVLHTAAGQLRSTTRLNWLFGPVIPAYAVLKAGHESGDGFEKLLDSLHSWTAAVQDGKHMSEQTTRLENDDDHPQHSQLPLRLFWYDMLSISPYFVASHSYRLWDRDDT